MVKNIKKTKFILLKLTQNHFQEWLKVQALYNQFLMFLNIIKFKHMHNFQLLCDIHQKQLKLNPIEKNEIFMNIYTFPRNLFSSRSF